MRRKLDQSAKAAFGSLHKRLLTATHFELNLQRFKNIFKRYSKKLESIAQDVTKKTRAESQTFNSENKILAFFNVEGGRDKN